MVGRDPRGEVTVDLSDVADLAPVREALAEAFHRSRDRIEAVAYMERHELLDQVERVGAALDRHLEEAIAGPGVESIDQPSLFTEAYAAVGLDLPPDVVDHVRTTQVAAWKEVTALAQASERLAGEATIQLPPAASGAEEAIGQRLGVDVARLVPGT
jgi:hypothetical protein